MLSWIEMMFNGKWKKNMGKKWATYFIYLYLLSHITDAYLTFQIPEQRKSVDVFKKSFSTSVLFCKIQNVT